MPVIAVLVCAASIAGAALPAGAGSGSSRIDRGVLPTRVAGQVLALRNVETPRSAVEASRSVVEAARSTLLARPSLGGGSAHRRRLASPRAKTSIVGGTDASIANFPFQVALYSTQAGSPAAGFFCGGVILDANHVATAAHCVVGNSGGPGEMAVLAGSSSLTDPSPGSVRDPVQSSAFDSSYNPVSSDDDVALLTLARPLWSGSAAPALNGEDTIAPLAPDPGAALKYGDPNASPTVLATASGWGDINPAPGHTPSYPASLRSVQVPLVSESLCEEQYAAIEQPITSSMICAGGGKSHVDTCYGDSGGPLVVDRDSPAHPPEDYVLVGLVDFGNGCAQPGYAGVYTRIASPTIVRFLNSGSGHLVGPVGSQAKHKKRKKHKKRRRHRG